MAIVTTTLSVNDIATQAHEGTVLALQIQRDRSDIKSDLNFALGIPAVVIPVVVIPSYGQIAD